ncbi:MAG: hypothetical protein SGCHY_000139 [Lobulomycetales sp.]
MGRFSVDPPQLRPKGSIAKGWGAIYIGTCVASVAASYLFWTREFELQGKTPAVRTPKTEK